jgi:SAM-dependent methyltransferase
MANPRHWRWHFSAPFYRRTYIGIAHQLDEDLFAYLGARTQGAVVADCGCGPGVVTEKFLDRGTERVFAIDVNPAMLSQVKERLPDAIEAGQVVVVQRTADAQLFSDLRHQFLAGGGFDVILFKRSLYVRREGALTILGAAVAGLNPGGVLAVIHGERSLRRYAFGPGLRPTHYTPYHLFNRTISRLGEILRLGDYTLYTQVELLDLLRTAAPSRQVELIPSQQQAYNLMAVVANS